VAAAVPAIGSVLTVFGALPIDLTPFAFAVTGLSLTFGLLRYQFLDLLPVAREMVINGMDPYLGANMALVGSNTYGKPVGQIALDQPACDDRLRAVALKIENANHQGEYYTGLASTVANTCRANDDIGHQLGDPDEAMVRVALDFLAGRSCTAISGVAAKATATLAPVRVAPERALLVPVRPAKTTDFELPGVY